MLRVFPARTIQFKLLSTKLWQSTVAAQVQAVNEVPTEPEKPVKSKRQQFREINPDMKVLNHLDAIRLGYLSKRAARVAVARKIDNNQIDMQDMKVGDSYSKKTPFPFKAKGKLLHQADDVQFIRHAFAGDPPEVGVIGRSNVGKSTLVNALVGFDTSFIQRAAMSERPGETRQLTFYQIGSVQPKYDDLPAQPSPSGHTMLGTSTNKLMQVDNTKNGSSLMKSDGNISFKLPVIHQQKPKTPALILVDMPGYGFSYSNKADKDRMQRLTMRYLLSNVPKKVSKEELEKHVKKMEAEEENNSTNNDNKENQKSKNLLKRVLVLLDARHGIKKADVDFFNELYEKMCIEYGHLKDTILSPQEIEKLKKPKNYINTNTPNTTNMVMTDEMIESIKTEKFHKKLSKLLHWKLQIVMTKGDLLERNDLCRKIMQVKANVDTVLPAVFRNDLPIVILSGKERKGLYDLQNELSALVPEEEANRLSDKERKWLLIREQRKKEYQTRLKSVGKDKMKEERKEKRILLKQKQEALEAAAKEEAEMSKKYSDPKATHGEPKIFRTRSASHPNDDVYGEREVKSKIKPNSKTAHLTPEEFHFRLHHETAYHPSPAPSNIEFLSEEPSEYESTEDDLMDFEPPSQPSEPVKAAPSTNHRIKTPVSKAASAAADAPTRGRRQRPMVTRVDGKTIFADVSEEYGHVGEPPAEYRAASKPKHDRKSAKNENDEPEEIDPIVAAMTKKAEDHAAATKRAKKSSTLGKRNVAFNEAIKSDLKESVVFHRTTATSTNINAHNDYDGEGFASGNDEVYAKLNPKFSQFQMNGGRFKDSSSSNSSEPEKKVKNVKESNQMPYNKVDTSVSASGFIGDNDFEMVELKGKLSNKKKNKNNEVQSFKSTANDTPYSDEELYKHASTEGFVSSAYDDVVVRDGKQVKIYTDAAGNVVKGQKLNRKQKRLRRQAKEKAIKEGTLYE